MLNLCESLVQGGSKSQTRQGQPLVNDNDFLLVIALTDLSAIRQQSHLRKIRSALRREHLRQMSHAQQFQHARCHVGELKGAWPLLDCGRLEANQRAEARAIQMFYITKVDNDATAKRNEGPYQLFYLTRGVTDQIAMTLDCRHLVPVFVFIFRLLKFTA